jgi:hypothetical protein
MSPEERDATISALENVQTALERAHERLGDDVDPGAASAIEYCKEVCGSVASALRDSNLAEVRRMDDWLSENMGKIARRWDGAAD